MSQAYPKIFKIFSPKRILLIIAIGLGVVTYMFISGFDKEAFLAIEWSWNASFWILMAIVMMMVRHFAYMYRIRMLTDKKLTWKTSFDVIMLWEFASAATPSIVGGSTVALFLLNKENISAGRSTTIVLFTAFLDEMFFIVVAPLFFLLAGKNFIFPDPTAVDIENLKSINSLVYFFIFGYVALFVYTLALAYGLFIRPRGLKWLLIRIFSIKLLRRWRRNALDTGEEIIISSKELQQKNLKFWLDASISTIFSWSARYFTINCIIMAFASVDNHFILYARQVVMWIIMLVTPTPGSSGMAEIVFSSFLVEYIPHGLNASLALLWRIISYYPYLFLGVIILPRWLRKVYNVSESGSGSGSGSNSKSVSEES